MPSLPRTSSVSRDVVWSDALCPIVPVLWNALTTFADRGNLARALCEGLCAGLRLHAGVERRVDPVAEVEGEVPGLEVFEDVGERHVRSAFEVAALRVGVPERLEVGDTGWAEPGLLRRGEAQEELGRVRHEVRAGDSGRERHPLRQAHPALEPTAGEADAHACRLEEVEREQRLRGALDGVLVVAAQEEGDVVGLEDHVLGVAREADRVGERFDRVSLCARGAQVHGDVRGGLVRDETVEVGEPPGSRHAEPGRRRLPAVLDRVERVRELFAGGNERRLVPGDSQLRGDDAVMEGRDDDLDPVVADDAQAVEHVLLLREARGRRARRSAPEPVDQLVQRAPGHGGRGRAGQ